MNRRQQAAIDNPCSRATDTVVQRFFAMIHAWSTILTVNKCLTFNGGLPVWHVSIALQSQVGPLPIARLSNPQVRKAASICERLLYGVGDGDCMFFTTDPPGCAIHAQKPLTKNEIDMLSVEWLAIPAFDERGPCKMLELK